MAQALQTADLPPDVVETLGLGDPGRPRRRRWWALVVVLVLAAAGLGAWWLLRSDGGRYTWETAQVSRGDLIVEVNAVGTLEPLHSVAVSSDLSGRVAQVAVETNDRVQAGDLLALLDTELLQAQLRQARAQLASARAALAEARVSADGAATVLARTDALHVDGVVADAEQDQARLVRDQAEAGIARAEAQVAQARASVDLASTNLSHAVISAPIGGVVLERRVDPGQTVVSALQAATLFTIAEDLAQMSVDVEVDEADIGRVVEGQAATFTVAAFPDRVFDAIVHKVELAPTPGQQVVTYIACLHLDNAEGLLRPGMTATAKIATERFDDVLLVPTAALRFEHPTEDLALPELRDGRKVDRVWVLREDTPEPVELLSSASDGRLARVDEGGLVPGDRVVIHATARREAATP